MKKLSILFILASFSCEKKYIDTSQVIYYLKFSETNLLADGTSLMTVSVRLDSTADTDRRKVVFWSSSGTFVGAAPDGTFTNDAEFTGRSLIASATWKVGAKEGPTTFSVKPSVVSPYSDFVVKATLDIGKSEPSKLIASASAFGVSTNFLGEVAINGVLKNSMNKNASSGYEVLFEDIRLETDSNANGRYREKKTISNDASNVSAIYSPGAINPGETIKIRITLLDQNHIPTNIKDSILVNVTI